MSDGDNRPPDPPTSYLARDAKDGDADRFARLYDRVAPAVFAWATLRIRPSVRALVDPEDVVQEVWCRALRRFHTFDAENAPFRPWVFRMANNVLLEAFKALRGHPVPRGGADGSTSRKLLAMEGVPDEATSISRKVSRHEGLNRFLEQVMTLSQEDRRLLLYRGLEGLAHCEVAERIGVGEDTVRKRWQRLRTHLETLGVPEELFETR